MAFNPDAYLAEKTGSGAGGFDPDAYLREKGAPAPEGAPSGDEISGLESGARGLVHGASFGSAPAVTGAVSALIDQLKGDPRTFGEAYQAERADSLKHYKAAQKANPVAYGAGDIAGNIGMGAALIPFTGGASIGGAVAAGALSQGLTAAGDAVSENKGAGETLADTASGAVGGAAGGLLGGLGGKLAGSALKKLTPKLATALDDLAVAQGRRAITSGSNALSNKAELSARAVRRAIDEGAVRPLSTVEGIAGRLEPLREQAGQNVGKILSELEAQGVEGPEAQAIARHLSGTGNDLGRNTVGTGVPELYGEDALGILKLPTNEGGRLGLTQAERLKRGFQDTARNEYGSLTGNGMRGDAKMNVAATVRDAVENEISAAGEVAGPNSKVGELASQFVPAKEASGDFIAASMAATKGAAQAARRKAFGPVAAISAVTGHAPSGALYHLANTRGASTVAWGARQLGKRVSKLSTALQTNPAALGKFHGILSRAAAQGPDKLATINFLLSKDPEFQHVTQNLPDQE